jgi:hypothetical protein
VTPTVPRKAVSRDDVDNADSWLDADSPSQAETAWRQSRDTSEMVDDPVRMYLREIGRVTLLKASEERVLARKMETAKHLEMIETELTSTEGRAPRAWQVVLQLLRRASDSTHDDQIASAPTGRG